MSRFLEYVLFFLRTPLASSLFPAPPPFVRLLIALLYIECIDLPKAFETNSSKNFFFVSLIALWRTFFLLNIFFHIHIFLCTHPFLLPYLLSADNFSIHTCMLKIFFMPLSLPLFFLSSMLKFYFYAFPLIFSFLS